MTPNTSDSRAKSGTGRRTAYVTLIVLAAFCAGAWAATRAGGGRPQADSHSDDAVQTGQSKPPAQTAEVERVALTRFGFNPRKITRPKGSFLLAVDDRSGLADMNISLVRVTGGKVHDVKAHRKNPRWASVVNLQPGDYRLVEAHHPDWSCDIKITPK